LKKKEFETRLTKRGKREHDDQDTISKAYSGGCHLYVTLPAGTINTNMTTLAPPVVKVIENTGIWSKGVRPLSKDV
jgi:hypothetical protein